MKSFSDNRRVFELVETQDYFMPGVPLMVRCDGRSFHTFTRGFDRPYDKDMSEIMKSVCKQVVEENLPCIGYTQSDEMTFIFFWETFEKMPWGGRKFKILSDLSTSVSNKFNYHIMNNDISKKAITKPQDMVQFDCRAFSVPSKKEAIAQLIDRERDAIKNSISMAAQSLFSHKVLHGKNGKEMQEMLFQKGVNWNDYPTFFKNGSYFRRTRVKRPFLADEFENLPEKHDARKNPNLIIERWIIEELNEFLLSKIENPVDVVFNGSTPNKAGCNGKSNSEGSL